MESLRQKWLRRLRRITVNDKSLEEVFEQLVQVVDQLEGANVSLEDSFQLYH